MIRKLLLFIAVVLACPVSVSAQDGSQQGHWALKINDAAIWVFSLEKEEDGSWQGSWLRPDRFEGNGVVFVRFSGEELVTTRDGLEREDVVQLRFAPTREGGSTDVLHFTMTGENEMSMEYLGTNLDPYPLVRVARGTGLGPFEDGLIYDRDNAVTVSDYDATDEPAEMAALEEAEAATLDAADEAEPVRRVGADFLDGVGSVEQADTQEVAAPDAAAEKPVLSRACGDLDRRNLPDPRELDTLWGDDYEQLGDGLDIREYVMTNGDIARVTVLEERIFLNHCGAV